MKKRTLEKMIRLTRAEKDALTEKAKMARRTREEFCRLALFGKTIKEAPPRDFFQMWMQLRRVGNLLYQLMDIAQEKDATLIQSLLDYTHVGDDLFEIAYVTKE